MVPPAADHQGARRAAAITEEQRRRNRMTSNRLSARKSRMKRQQYVDGLAAEVERLQREHEAMCAWLCDVVRQSCSLEQENRVLAAYARQLYTTLQLRNSQLILLGNVAGVPLDVPAVPDHLVQLYGGVQMPGMPLSPSVTPISPPAMPLSPSVTPISPPVMSLSPPVTPLSPPVTPFSPSPPPLQLQLPLEIQLMLLQDDVMDAVDVGMLEF